MAHLFSNWYEKQYKAPFCSFIFFFWLFGLISTVWFAFTLTYSTGGLWKHQEKYYEHADSQFTGKLVIALLDDTGKQSIYSTINGINESLTGGKMVPSIAINRKVNVTDGKVDQIKLDIVIPGSNPSAIRNFQVHGSFQYNLDERLKIEMKGLMQVDIDTPNGVSKAFIHGDLNLDQEEPVLIDSKKRQVYNADLLDQVADKKLTMLSLFEEYQSRKEKLKYNYKHLIQPRGSPYKTTISITVNIPLGQRVVYIPGTLETLKFGWIQILAILLPCIWIFREVCGFLFRNQFVELHIVSDLAVKNRGKGTIGKQK